MPTCPAARQQRAPRPPPTRLQAPARRRQCRVPRLASLFAKAPLCSKAGDLVDALALARAEARARGTTSGGLARSAEELGAPADGLAGLAHASVAVTLSPSPPAKVSSGGAPVACDL